jgi:4-hydroxybenzoyl-CoA reductase subunit beta
MKLPDFELIQPHSVKEACSTFGEHREKAALLAGGTALMVALRFRLSKPAVVINLKGLSALESVRRNERGGLSIGSMVTLEALAKSPLVLDGFAPLAEAAGLVAVPPIRHMATIGGNLSQDTRCIYYNQSEFWRSGLRPCFKQGGSVCNAVEKGRRCQAVYQGDLGPVLMAMGAEVKIASAEGEKIIPLAEFFTGRGERPNVLKPGDILVEVLVPASGPGTGGAYEKLRVREGMDFPMAAAAVMLKANGGGAVETVKMVLGAVGSSPIEVGRIPALLKGERLTDALLQAASEEAIKKAAPAGNLVMSTDYRKMMVGELAKRALRRAMAMVPR